MADWYKRSPREALNGMRLLPAMERAVYGAVLDLIYEEERPVALQLIVAECRDCGRRYQITAALDALVKAGKLHQLKDGSYSNLRAEYELQLMTMDQATRRKAASKAARARWKEENRQPSLFEANANADAELSNEINEGGMPGASYPRGRAREETGQTPPKRQRNANDLPMKRQQHANADGEKPNEFNGTPMPGAYHKDTDKDLRERNTQVGAKKVEADDDPDDPFSKPVKRRRSRTPPKDWAPPQLNGQCSAITNEWDTERWELEVERFTAFHANRHEGILDWDAAWRTWVLQSPRFERRQAYDRPDPLAEYARKGFGPHGS